MIEELIRLCKLKDLDFTISSVWSGGMKFEGSIEGDRKYRNAWGAHEDISGLIDSMCEWIRKQWADEIV